MTVVKCDMCGKVLDAGRFKVQIIQRTEDGKYVKSSSNIHDLCEDCATKIKKLMEEGASDIKVPICDVLQM